MLPLEKHECWKPWGLVVVDGITNLNGAALRIVCNFFFQFNE
jgi:hypothetical protein